VSAFAVHPGIVETPLWRHLWSRGSCFGGIFSMLARSSVFGVKSAAQVSSGGAAGAAQTAGDCSNPVPGCIAAGRASGQAGRAS